jgi:hypothetical protein
MGKQLSSIARFLWFLPFVFTCQVTLDAQENRIRDQRSYKTLEDLPPNVAEKLPCPKEYGDECPTKVRLKRETIVWGVPLKAHTIASDWEEDRNGTLARDFEYNGVWLKGGSSIQFYFGWGGTLARNQVLQGVPCRGGHAVSFGHDGRLTECTLTASHKVGNKSYPAGTHLLFDERGQVIEYKRQ